MKLRSIDWPAVLLMAILFAQVAYSAQPAGRGGTKATQRKSLDEELLDDLETNPRRASPPEDNGQRPIAKRSQPATLEDELLEGLEGEDVSPGSGAANENPLVRLNQRMKQVEQRIAEARVDEKTQRLQQEISDDLSKLIAELERQCSQCNKQSSSSRQQSSRPKPGSDAAQQASDKPAQDSSTRTKPKETSKVDPARLQEMLKDVWGHLPAHLRQQMEQSANEEFLPKYELEIAEYYRSLVGGRHESRTVKLRTEK